MLIFTIIRLPQFGGNYWYCELYVEWVGGKNSGSLQLLYSEKHITGGYTPHLTFNILVQSNIFSVHQYKREYPERESVRIKVWELHKEGWGYTKIHRYLKKNGFEIGDSRTTVDSMIKKMKKREYILGLQDQIRKYEDFKIQYFRL